YCRLRLRPRSVAPLREPALPVPYALRSVQLGRVRPRLMPEVLVGLARARAAGACSGGGPGLALQRREPEPTHRQVLRLAVGAIEQAGQKGQRLLAVDVPERPGDGRLIALIVEPRHRALESVRAVGRASARRVAEGARLDQLQELFQIVHHSDITDLFER